jgi:hypothetical protein
MAQIARFKHVAVIAARNIVISSDEKVPQLPFGVAITSGRA